VVWAIWGR